MTICVGSIQAIFQNKLWSEITWRGSCEENEIPNVSNGRTNYQLNEVPSENQFANKYLKHLLEGDNHSARQLIFNEVEGGFPVKRIYMEVFQWSQRELGYLWETNQINVADEHFGSATTQSIMAQLYPYIATTSQNDKKAIITCVSG